MKVRIVKDWNYPQINRQTPSCSGIWNGVEFTEDNLDECDFLIVLNRPSENIVCKVRTGGVWLFTQESPIPIYEWHKKSYPYFDRVYTFWNDLVLKKTKVIHSQTSLPWHIDRDFDFLNSLKCPIDKLDRVSWITSNASTKEGHMLRLSFLKYLQLSKFEFDLFGRGFQPIQDKFDGLFPYKYSIAIENFSCNDYWTEKIADCFLSWTLPIYFGCKNILDYFPSNSILLVDPSKPEEALKIIQNAIKENEWEKRKGAIEEARNLVLNKYQLFPQIVSHINKANLPNKKRLYAIPSNSKGNLSDLSLYLKIRTLRFWNK